jgi:hypothetical protein
MRRRLLVGVLLFAVALSLFVLLAPVVQYTFKPSCDSGALHFGTPGSVSLSYLALGFGEVQIHSFYWAWSHVSYCHG